MSAVKEPMKRKEYEKALRELQVELCGLQEWVKHKGLRSWSCSRAATPLARAG
jgi:polyphosphate kinase 2 (PPK2 family)